MRQIRQYVYLIDRSLGAPIVTWTWPPHMQWRNGYLSCGHGEMRQMFFYDHEGD